MDINLDTAFVNLIPQGATLIADGRPEVAFADLRYQAPTPPPLECELEALPTIKPKNKLTEKMRGVYGDLLRELRRFEPKSVLFTAFDIGQGTTFTAENLATMWAANEPPEKILLCEFYSGVNEDEYRDEDGEIFYDCQQVESYLYYNATQKIYRLTACASAATLDSLPALFQRLNATFTRVLVDVTPVGYNPLFSWFAKQMNGTILIARQPPEAKIVKQFVDELRELGGRFMGVILNANDENNEKK